MSSSSSTQTLRQLDDLIKDVASLTGMSQRQIKEQVTTLDVPAFNFQGIVLVPSDVVDPLIDRWAADIKAKLHQGVTVAFLSSNGAASVEVINQIAASTSKATSKAAPKSKKATKAEQNGAAAVKVEAKPEPQPEVKPVAKSEPKAEAKPEPQPEVKSEVKSAAKPEPKVEAKPEPRSEAKAESKVEAKPEPKEAKPEPKAETKPKASAPKTEAKLSELKLPKGFSQQVSNRYGPTLDKLLPEDFEDRLVYLKEITDESSLGTSYLNRIATVIQRKYKGRTARSTAYRGLLSKAQDMLENLKAGDAIISQLGQETA